MASKNEGSKQSGNQGSNEGKGTSNRGFASMDPQRQREIASEGGKAAHEKGTAEEARRAGSMSHGNRQSEQSSARTASEKDEDDSKRSGNKQSTDAGNKSGSDKR